MFPLFCKLVSYAFELSISYHRDFLLPRGEVYETPRLSLLSFSNKTWFVESDLRMKDLTFFQLKHGFFATCLAYWQSPHTWSRRSSLNIKVADIYPAFWTNVSKDWSSTNELMVLQESTWQKTSVKLPSNTDWWRRAMTNKHIHFSEQCALCNLGFNNWCFAPDRFVRLREICRHHPALISCQHDVMRRVMRIT